MRDRSVSPLDVESEYLVKVVVNVLPVTNKQDDDVALGVVYHVNSPVVFYTEAIIG